MKPLNVCLMKSYSVGGKRQLAVWTLRKMEYQFLLLYRAH